jgi:nucleoid DNA-binding protein
MVHRMAEKTDLTHIKAQEIVEAILQKIKNALRHGDSVILRGLGQEAPPLTPVTRHRRL